MRFWNWFLGKFIKEEVELEDVPVSSSYRHFKVERKMVRRVDWEGIKEKVKKMGKVFWDNAITMVIFGVVLFVLFIGGYSIYRTINASGRVEYCYVENYTSEGKEVYYLSGQVDWDRNRRLGKFDTLEETIKAAEALGCEIK